LAKSLHYTFIIPDKYVGWVQIIFNDPGATEFVLRNGGYQIDVPESGICRTSYLRVHDFRRRDMFYYRSQTPNGMEMLVPVPSEYVMPGDSHGGFGVMDTGGKGPGYSWFIFFGPPQMRAKVPLANWNQVVEEYQETHGGRTRIDSPVSYPTPGRMPSTGAVPHVH